MSTATQAAHSAKLIGIKEAASTLGLSVWTLYAWSNKGKVASHKVGNRVLFSLNEIARIVEESERPRIGGAA